MEKIAIIHIAVIRFLNLIIPNVNQLNKNEDFCNILSIIRLRNHENFLKLAWFILFCRERS